MGLSRQEYWSGLPFPSPGDLSDTGIESASLMTPALEAGPLPVDTWKAPPSSLEVYKPLQ